MRRFLRAYLFCFIALPNILAQTQPCGPVAEMTSFCNEACIICDINGFTGINDDPIVGQAPPGFCTSVIHHMQWIGFIAGSTNLTITVTPHDCQSGSGLEIGIYKSLDCTNFQLVTNCDTDVQQGEVGSFSNIVPLTIGQYYYLVMDGNQGDICKYTVNVVSGTTAVSALPYSGMLAGDFTPCPNRMDTYTLLPPAGATNFLWMLDGNVIKNGVDTTTTLNWVSPGIHQLCVIASNICDTALPACQTIYVTTIPPTNIYARICEGECWTGADTMICDPGLYTFHFEGHEACDSTVIVQIDKFPISATSLNLMICKGDTLSVGEVPFFDTGHYVEVLANQDGCDSTVTLDLLVIVCEIQGKLTTEPVSCNGAPDGALHFWVTDGTPPLHYSWERIGNATPAGAGIINTVNSEVVVPDLPQGTFFVTITDDFGHTLVMFEDVTEPLPLAATFTTSDYHGFSVSCEGSSDGFASMTPSGGSPPYQFLWNNGAATIMNANITAGTYSCTLTDKNDCTSEFSVTLTEPPFLQFKSAFTDPGCAGLNSGAAVILSAQGGVQPYEYALSDGGFSHQTIYDQVAFGPQTLTIRDTNGCTADTSVILPKPNIPKILMSENITIELAESTPLQILSNVPLENISWTPAMGLSCDTCSKTNANPYTTTTYTAVVSSAVNHCSDTGSVTVTVLDIREVYVPNIFNPHDENGRNGFFTVYGGAEVKVIVSLKIWSRWGELVFNGENFEPNTASKGWDGTSRNKTVNPGVFTWQASVEFVDGKMQTLTGNVTLL